MTAQNTLTIVTVVALLSIVAFLVVYAIRARKTWWSDPLGRVLMLGGFAVGCIAAVGTVRRIDTRVDSIDLAHEIVVASIFAYLAVSAVWLYKTFVVYQETRRKRDDDDGKDGDS